MTDVSQCLRPAVGAPFRAMFRSGAIDECPSHRFRRPRARAGLGAFARARCASSSLRARQCRHRRSGTNVRHRRGRPCAPSIAFCRDNGIGFVVVGPEAPLVAGLVDDLAAAGIKAFGPTKAAAQLEGSKGFTKDLCAEFGIPTAAYRRFTRCRSRPRPMSRRSGAPIVVKADGLAAGKGVVVAETAPRRRRPSTCCSPAASARPAPRS